MKNCYVIVNKNDYKTTKHLVDNIIDYNNIDEILIIDNASNEEEKKLISSIKNPKIEKIFNNEDLGYSSAINKACNYLIDKYDKCNFIISNSDIVILSENDLDKLLELLSYESVGLVGPQILERGKVIRGRRIPSVRRDIISNLPVFHHFIKSNGDGYKDSYYKDDTSTVEVISSAFFLITSKTLKKIRFLDEHVFLFYEDNILGVKMKEAGLMTLIHNKVKVKHLFSSTIEKTMNDKTVFDHLCNSQMYFHKKYSKATPFQLRLLKISNRIRFNHYMTKKIIKKK